jgi:hypothetical protein
MKIRAADKTRMEYKTNPVGEKTKLYKTKPTRQPADSTGPELYFRKNCCFAQCDLPHGVFGADFTKRTTACGTNCSFTKRTRQAEAPVAPFTKRNPMTAWVVTPGDENTSR